MIFTLEALEARGGDSLVLHYGTATRPKFVVIDGGPAGVLDKSLAPRLNQLHAKWQRDGMLDIDMVMVSHIDDDHINGILKWFKSMARAKEDHNPVPYNIGTLWFNSFDEILGNDSDDLKSKVANVSDAVVAGTDAFPASSDPRSFAVVASVRQGRLLRAFANSLQVKSNRGFHGLVAGHGSEASIPLGDGLRFLVVCPSQVRLEALQKDWDKDIEQKKDIGVAEVAAFTDRAVANLSSIVVLAEFGEDDEKKTMLLTGDARGDDIIAGLKDAGAMTDGKPFHVNVMKVPHHGSNRNTDLSFFKTITADHYVISANGEYNNPDREIFEWIAKARGRDRYTIWITNSVLVEPKKNVDIRAIVNSALAYNRAPNRSVIFRERVPSLKIDLLDEVNY